MTKHTSILQNIALLLEKRGLCTAKEAYASFMDTFDEVNVTANTVDPPVYVKIINEQVKNINRIPGIMQFVQNDTGAKHILVVQNIFCQPYKTLMALDNVEVFRSFELENNLFSNQLIPYHRILDQKEIEEVMVEYNIRSKELSKMDKTDFVARYLGMKVGDWVEIQRPSITSGISVGYRVVTNCAWEKLFQ